jgi:Cu(I)/Ag(I) efflux system membrane fusion protein
MKRSWKNNRESGKMAQSRPFPPPHLNPEIKDMKRYLNLFFLLLALVTAAGCSQQSHEHTEGTTEYTCPMHPQIVQDKPGACPVCGMDLVPKSGHSEGIEITEDLAFLLRPTNSTVVASIGTIKPEQKTVAATITLDGIITYDPRQVYSVPARIGGRIERLLVKYNFQPIRKGQKLLELYSPDLITAQQELLYLVQSAPEDTQLQAAAKQKLRFLGATNTQINQLLRTGKASYSFAIYSPYDGYVIGLNTATPTAAPSAAGAGTTNAGGGMDAMGGGSAGAAPVAAATPAPMAASPDIQLREGMYVSAGQPLLRVVNPSQLWAEFNVPASEVALLAKGAPVQLSFPQLPGEQLSARVDFRQPYYQEGENFARIRVYLLGKAKGVLVGQLVSARVTHTTGTALWVPQEAVLNLGTQSVAFKKVNGVFEAVQVTAGITEGKQTQIISGLQPDEAIAANAQFLVDSESFIKVNK